jgi:hypothetical protein
MMSQKSRHKIGIMVYLDPELLDRIDEAAPQGKRSLWIAAVCEEKLARESTSDHKKTGLDSR